MLKEIPQNTKQIYRNGVLPKFFYVQNRATRYVLKFSG